MKGIVFTEFLEMVEKEFGIDTVDDIIDASNLDSGGSYTSVATYPVEELLSLTEALSQLTQTPVNRLVHSFGQYLANSFVEKFPSFFEEQKTTLEFLKRVDQHIHVEVKKLYPEAELPKFTHQQKDQHTLLLHYQSTRNLPDLAHGLIEGSSLYYKENIDIQRTTDNSVSPPIETFTISYLPSHEQ